MRSHTFFPAQRALFILFLLFTFSSSSGQDTYPSVVAKTGDGIFSVLRKSGIHPIKYYEEFLRLNSEYIKNGSELIVGKEYRLPNAPDSFKVTGIRIDASEGEEGPIFNEEQLSLMNLKDSTLRNTVYYFVHSGVVDSKKRFDDVANRLAKDLMLKGARVYILENSKMEKTALDSLPKGVKMEMYGEYSSIINKKYLRHNGSYQRVILLEDTIRKHQNMVLSISHNGQSKEGLQFASVLSEVLRKNAVVPSKVKNETNPFKDKESMYLANNLIPPVIILNFTDASHTTVPGFNLKSEKKSLVGLLNDGILEDYSQLNLEN